jgi:hypothetical protein
MKGKDLGLCLTAVVFGLSSASILFPQSSSDTPLYLDPKRTIDERIDDLMSRMTLKEKVGQLNLPCVYVDQLGKAIPEKTKIGPGAASSPCPTKSSMRALGSRPSTSTNCRKLCSPAPENPAARR